MRSHANTPPRVPDLDLAIQGCRQQILARIVPVQRCDPGGPAARCCEVAYMLAMLHVVNGDDARISGRGETFAPGRESDGPDGLGETYFPSMLANPDLHPDTPPTGYRSPTYQRANTPSSPHHY